MTRAHALQPCPSPAVVHFSLKKSADYADPVRSKERLLFSTGLRTFPCRPIFSTDEHQADKFKMEKFLHAGRHACATVFAPISFPPLPLLAFKMPESETGVPRLVATGSLKSCDPDRVVLKKIVLTGAKRASRVPCCPEAYLEVLASLLCPLSLCALVGYPVKVHKRKATVKHMFYNPDDVKWFKPLEGASTGCLPAGRELRRVPGEWKRLGLAQPTCCSPRSVHQVRPPGPHHGAPGHQGPHEGHL